MQAIRKKPGCEPELIDIDNTLAALQQEVGGYIETVSIADVVIVCKEEGRLCGLPYNCRFVGVGLSSARSSWSAVTRTSSAMCRRLTS